MIERGESSSHATNRHTTIHEQDAHPRQHEYKARESSYDIRKLGLSDCSELKAALDFIVSRNKPDKGKGVATNRPQDQSFLQDESENELAASELPKSGQISRSVTVKSCPWSLNEDYELWLAADAAETCSLPESAEVDQTSLDNFEMSDPWMEGILERASWSIDSAEFGDEDSGFRDSHRSDLGYYDDADYAEGNAFPQYDDGYASLNAESEEHSETTLLHEEPTYGTQGHVGTQIDHGEYAQPPLSQSPYTPTAGPSHQPIETPISEPHQPRAYSPPRGWTADALAQARMSGWIAQPSFRLLGVRQRTPRYPAPPQKIKKQPAQRQSAPAQSGSAHPPGYHTLFPESFRITVPAVRECVRRQQDRIRAHMPKSLRWPPRLRHER
ncbi:hypothetical protein GGR57DRAFT_499376 [Xylariaceae sp. FL1272]|nr:hypothetical protein GGR57DRAFT_499376 [Xylariaceae sp. FL1272]